MTVLWFNLGFALIPRPGWEETIIDWVTLLALSWHIEYQSKGATWERRLEVLGGWRWVWAAWPRLPSAFEGLYPAAGVQDTGWGLQLTLIRNWAPFGLKIGKSRDTCLKHVKGNLQVSASRSQLLLGKEISTDSALWSSSLLAYAGREPVDFSTIALRVPS